MKSINLILIVVVLALVSCNSIEAKVNNQENSFDFKFPFFHKDHYESPRPGPLPLPYDEIMKRLRGNNDDNAIPIQPIVDGIPVIWGLIKPVIEMKRKNDDNAIPIQTIVDAIPMIWELIKPIIEKRRKNDGNAIYIRPTEDGPIVWDIKKPHLQNKFDPIHSTIPLDSKMTDVFQAVLDHLLSK